MQSLPEIEQLLADWYLRTLENPLYAGAIAIAIWLLVVLFYSIRIYFLKKTQRITEQAKAELQSQLTDVKQQQLKSEELLTGMTEQLAREQLLATEFSVRVEERNQQIIDNIKNLANKFDLSEQLLSTEGEHKAEFVWQQHDNIQTQLTDRLQAEKQEKETLESSYQQEKAQVAEQGGLIEQLQEKLDQENGRVKDLEVQKQVHQQEKLEADKVLVDLLAQHKLDVVALNKKIEDAAQLAIDVEKFAVQAAVPVPQEESTGLKNLFSQQESKPVKAAPVEGVIAVEEVVAAVTEDLAISVEESVSVEPAEVVEVVVEPVVSVVDEGPELEEVAEDIISNVLDAQLEFFEEEEPTFKFEDQNTEPVTEPESVAADYSEPKADLTKKLKGFFGKGKKVAPEVEQVVSQPKPKVAGKLKGLLGKAKKQVAALEPEDIVEEIVEATEAVVAKPKQVIEETIAEVAAEIPELVPSVDYAKSKMDVSAKLKGLWGKGKKKAKQIDVAPVLEEVADIIEPVAEPKKILQEAVAKVSAAAEQKVAVPVGDTKASLDVSGKLKGLWGKAKKEAKAEVVEAEQVIDKVLASTEKVGTASAEKVDAQHIELSRAAMREAEAKMEEEFEPNYGESNVHIFSSLKKMFGKG